MADITTVYNLNTSKTSESRLWSYFYSSAERNFRVGNSNDSKMTQLAYSDYVNNYYTGYFKMNTTSTGGVAMSRTNDIYYPVGGRLKVTRAGSMGSYGKVRTLYYGYSTANSYTLGTAHAGTVARVIGQSINPASSPGPTTTFAVDADFCEKVIAGRFITTGFAIKPTSNSYPADLENYLGIVLDAATDAVLEIDWITRDAAPYWGGGQTVDVSPNPAANGRYVAAGTTFTVSWDAANDTQGNISNYLYGISTNGGASRTYAWTGGAGNRSFTYQNWTAGAVIQFAVQAYDSNGLASSWIYSGNTTINYVPGAPSNLQFSNNNGASYEALATNSILKVSPTDTQIAFSAPSHSGGFQAGYSALKYKQIGSVEGFVLASSPIDLIGLARYAGSTMNIGIAATDGWATTSSSTFSCRIGLALTGGAISLTKGGVAQGDTFLDQLTEISCARTYIDNGNSVVNESVVLQYQIDSGTWRNLLSTTRTKNTANIFTEIFKAILIANPNFLQANHSVNFRVVYTINHLSLTSSTLSTTYTMPTFTRYISQADGSATFKYPLDDPNIPITYDSVGAYYNFVRASSNDDNIGYIQCQYSLDNGLNWINYGSMITIDSGLDDTDTLTVLFSSIAGFSKGETLLVRLHIYMSLGGTTYTLANTALPWNNAGALTTIKFNDLPTVTLTKITGQQLSLITNDSAINKVILPFNVHNDDDIPIDFAIGVKIGAGSEVFAYMDNSDQTWFSSIGLADTELILTITASSTENTETWALEDLQVNALTPVLSLSGSVPDSTKDIAVVIKIYTQDGLSEGRQEVVDINNANQSIGTLNYLINTLCQPIFPSGAALTLTRL